jgi:hypothetical protein
MRCSIHSRLAGARLACLIAEESHVPSGNAIYQIGYNEICSDPEKRQN